MAVIIADMDKPDSCRGCRLRQGLIMKTMRAISWCGADRDCRDTPREGIPDWCPLIQVTSWTEVSDGNKLIEAMKVVSDD
ncbi:MAG: hypothetical protein FWD45_05680 [Coriobacteriia bacterium]|nr:hypothetical protein [Coriobacteriia bacterium]